MADLTRGTRPRRGARRPGWLLLTVLLLLAIGASSALVFTNRAELLKLAVILALWAAVVAAFVSVIYRRQSDIDQAKVRDLKLVYDLQLDREISARREYELSVETQLRRELTSEIRAQAADEVAGLRAELAALRANLEILFDADLSHRPALETDRARAYSDWPRDGRIDGPGHRQPDRHRRPRGRRREHRGKPHHRRACRTPSARGRVGATSYGGAHRRPSETEQEERRRRAEEAPRAWSPPPPQPQPEPVSQPTPEPQFAWQPPQQERPPAPPPEPPPPRPEPERVAQTPPTDWQPAPAEGQWIPVGTPGSNWVSPDAGFVASADGRERLGRPICRQETRTRAGCCRFAASAGSCQFAGSAGCCQIRRLSRPCRHRQPPRPPLGTAGRRRSGTPTGAAHFGRRIRGSPATRRARAGADLAPQPEARRHRSAEDTGGQSVADLLARLHATPTGGGRRRRREE